MPGRKTKRWFAALLLFESLYPEERRIRKLFELQVRLIRAGSEQAAWDRANEIGNDRQHSFANVYGNNVEWVLHEVVDVVELLDDAMKEGAEVYYAFLSDREARRISTTLQSRAQSRQRKARRPLRLG